MHRKRTNEKQKNLKHDIKQNDSIFRSHNTESYVNVVKGGFGRKKVKYFFNIHFLGMDS